MSEALPLLRHINGPVKSILKEMVISARQRKSKSYPTLCEAYTSLNACPIQFTSLGQLVSLAGFEEALVDKIDMRLNEWCIDHGTRYADTQAESSKAAGKRAFLINEEETDSDLDDLDGCNAKRKSSSKKTKSKEKTVRELTKVAKQKSTVEKVPKIFIPQHRTGTHGILVALFTFTANSPGQGFEPDSEEVAEANGGIHYFSKATVIQFAQPYSDAKYIPTSNPAVNGFGSSYHSAWSGMKTLINRGYVYRKGNPASFGLSHEGWKVAKICSEREKGLSAGCNHSKIGSLTTTFPTTNEETSKKKKNSTSKKVATIDIPTSATTTTHAPFLYTYLTDSHPPGQTTNRDHASIRLNDDDYRMMYRIAFACDSKQHPFVINCVQGVVKDGDFMCGWVKEAACNRLAPGFNVAQASSIEDSVKGTRKNKTTQVEEAPLKLMTEKQPSTKINGKEALREQMSSQGNVIELLTSSDVEGDKPKCCIQIGTWISNRGQYGHESDSESDSALSDLAPAVKQRKITKR